MSITGPSGQAIAGSPITGDVVPPQSQSRIDMSTKLLSLTTTGVILAHAGGGRID